MTTTKVIDKTSKKLMLLKRIILFFWENWKCFAERDTVWTENSHRNWNSKNFVELFWLLEINFKFYQNSKNFEISHVLFSLLFLCLLLSSFSSISFFVSFLSLSSLPSISLLSPSVPLYPFSLFCPHFLLYFSYLNQ